MTHSWLTFILCTGNWLMGYAIGHYQGRQAILRTLEALAKEAARQRGERV